MQAKHDKKIVSSCVALVFGRIKNDPTTVLPFSKINNLLKENNSFEGLPFLWIGMLCRLGIRNNLRTKIGKIDQSDGELPIAVELDMEILQWADQNNLELLHDIFMIAALEAVIQVGEKYKFSTEIFKEERKKYGSIPDTLEACHEYQRPSENFFKQN